MNKFKKVLLFLVIIGLSGVFLFWLATPNDTPGEAVAIQGREHLKADEAPPVYNSNPPTSGAHDQISSKPGFYEYSLADRNVVHSLEHGHVVISYNCGSQVTNDKGTSLRGKGLSIFPAQAGSRLGGDNFQLSTGEVWAHGEEASPSVQASPSASKANTSDENCHKLKDALRQIFDKFKGWKLIVEPRENLETRLALTSWGRIYKFNPATLGGLGSADIKKIEKFINAFRDKAPEQTPD